MKAKKVIVENIIDVASTFNFLTELHDLKEPIKFLESLNLTYDQYNTLNNILEEYGMKKYHDGEDDEYMRNIDSGECY